MTLEVRLFKGQCSRAVDVPGTCQILGISEANESSIVMTEVQVVGPERIFDPARHLDQRWSVDVVAHPFVHVWTNNRIIW